MRADLSPKQEGSHRHTEPQRPDHCRERQQRTARARYIRKLGFEPAFHLIRPWFEITQCFPIGWERMVARGYDSRH